MSVEIIVPTLGESVSDATVARWIKKAGDAVAADEPIVELETDKVTLEVPSPVAGRLEDIVAEEGATVEVGTLLARVAEGAMGAPAEKARTKPAEPAAAQPAAAAPAVAVQKPAVQKPAMGPADTQNLSPAVRRLVEEHNLNPATIAATGVGGRLTKGDVMAAIKAPQAPAPAAQIPAAPRATPREVDAAREERVRMSKLRQVIASRLKTAQNTAAMLTTFNEVDMSALMKMRAEYKDVFESVHEVRLGFMGVFVQAVI
jgi:2-oxoglutarate dehydrogenase E2 component (dihydrolipoamide succinyltransferase)